VVAFLQCLGCPHQVYRLGVSGNRGVQGNICHFPSLRDTNGLASRRTGALSTTHATDLMLGIGCHVSPSDPIEGKGRRKRDYESFVGETAPAVDHPATRARLGSGSGHSLGHLPVGAPPGVLWSNNEGWCIFLSSYGPSGALPIKGTFSFVD
jgi:hypothetical protein